MANPNHALHGALAAATSSVAHPALAGVKSVLQVRAADESSAELLIYGEIGESWWSESVTAASVVREIADLRVATINVRINSGGGSVADGLAIYNALKRHPARKVVTIDGVAASIASLIAMAGDEVVMPGTSLMMLHAPWSYTGGNAAQLREYADVLDQHARAMATAYADKTGKPIAEIEALLTDGADHWFTAAEAIEFGLAEVQRTNEAEEDTDSAAAALKSLLGIAAKAPGRVAARLQTTIARTALPAFARFAAPIQAAVLAALPEETPMKQQLQTIFANGAGPAAGANPPPAAAPAAAAPNAAPAAPVLDANALAERNRTITAMFAAYRNNPEAMEIERACLIDPNMTVANAGDKLMALIGRGNEPLGGQDPVVAAGGLPTASVIAGRDERDARVQQAVQGIIARAGRAGANDAQYRQGNPFAGMSLLQLGERCLIQSGISASRLRNMDRLQLAQAILNPARVLGAQTTSDFSTILENALHKLLLQGYTLRPFTWDKIARVGTLSDLRPHGRYHSGSFSSLATKNEAGEYVHGTLGDGKKETIQGAIKGRILSVTQEVIINDDLGALAGAATSLGQAAGRTIENDVYALLALNSNTGPTMSDSVVLFHTSHGNVASTAAVPSVASFGAARILMGAQQDASGNDYLDLTPAIWLGPLSQRDAADTTNNSAYDPDTSNKLQRKNTAFGLVRDILDTPRLTGTRWYLFADPQVEAVLEVAFLDGNRNPTITAQTDFASSNLEWKVEHIYAVGAVGWKGAVTNAGTS